MPAHNDKLDAQRQRNTELQEKLDNLDEELAEKQAKYEQSEQVLWQRQIEFDVIQRKLKATKRFMHRFVRLPRTTAAYLLGRRNKKKLYSKVYKQKEAENQLKAYRYYLYEAGFIEKTLDDLNAIFEQPENRYQKRAVAWELALWHASNYTNEGANRALMYLRTVMEEEKDVERLQKASIIKAECLEVLGKTDKAKHVIMAALEVKQHPDLFLAYANLEGSIEAKTEWINKAMAAYNLQPICFSKESPNGVKSGMTTARGVAPNESKRNVNSLGEDPNLSYDDLTTKPMDRKIENGPKVSVILPAYNAEDGISTAIRSILSQTWQNIELLVVDDCSSDRTPAIVRHYMKHDSRITLMSTPSNSGPYAARNIALKEATGEFITINDADDWSHAEKIETQVKHLQANKKMIANTSEHARLTDKLTFYRRGTPGKYIFSNMSSLMFRRKPVLKKIGYWDNVRFAADGEFKRRLIKTFGQDSIIDLKTGPLSLPRQSVSSLTGSSEFGYNGFFKGVRKEYVESFEYHHQHARSLYYPQNQSDRLFPVPEPMRPKREVNINGKRHVDIVVAADFRLSADKLQETINEIQSQKALGLTTGLVQMGTYTLNTPGEVNENVRSIIDGNHVQMLVYGEKITCNILLIKDPSILQERQKYIPDVSASAVLTVIEQAGGYNIRTTSSRLMTYFGKKGKWYPKNATIRDKLQYNRNNSLRFIRLAHENWQDLKTGNQMSYQAFLDNWLVDSNPYLKGDGYNR